MYELHARVLKYAGFDQQKIASVLNYTVYWTQIKSASNYTHQTIHTTITKYTHKG